MSISKIEEIQKYDHERKLIMCSRNKKQEIGNMPEHLCNSNEIIVSSKNVSAAKCKDNHKIKSTPKETIGEILNSSVVKEQSLLDQDRIHVTECNSEFVTKNIHMTDSENKFVTEKINKETGGENTDRHRQVLFSIQILAENGWAQEKEEYAGAAENPERSARKI